MSGLFGTLFWLCLVLSGSLWNSLVLFGCHRPSHRPLEGPFTDPFTGPYKSPSQTLQGSMKGFMSLLKQAFSLGAGYAAWQQSL